MFHDTKTSLLVCDNNAYGSRGDGTYIPKKCEFSKRKLVLHEQSYSGLAYGMSRQLSIVFLQTNNWRVSMKYSFANIHEIYDPELFMNLLQ